MPAVLSLVILNVGNRVAYAITLHGLALLIAGTLALVLAATPSASTGPVDGRWRWFGWFAILKGLAVIGLVSLGTAFRGWSNDSFQIAYLMLSTPAWLAGARFAWVVHGRPGRRKGALAVVAVCALAGVTATLLAGLPGAVRTHTALAGAAGLAMLGALVALARSRRRLGDWRGFASLGLMAAGLAGLVALEMLGGEYHARFQGWTMNTLPLYVRAEFGLMLAGAVFAWVLALGWWAWMRRHVGGAGVRPWLTHTLWMVPVVFFISIGGGFSLLTRISTAGNARADRLFFIRTRLAAEAVSLSGARADARPEELQAVLRRLVLADPEVEAIWFARMQEGRALPVAATHPDVPFTEELREWRRGGAVDPKFAESRVAFDSSAMQDELGSYVLFCQPWPEPGAGWIVFRYTYDTWAAAKGPVLAQSTIIMVLGGVLGISLLVLLLQRELGAEARLKSARAEAADRAKTELIARVSHELRTPIQGVLGYADLLRRAKLEPAQREWLDTLDRQGRQLLRLVNDLLDLGALQTGRLRFEMRPFAPAEVASSAMAAIKPQAEAKGLDCSLVVEPGVPGGVSGDAVRLQQILVNLLGNAVKFTRTGGVELRAGASAHGESCTLSFAVADTGPGLTEDEIRTVFDPLPRLQRSRPGAGTGLGLALARSLCKAMAGGLEVESTPGRGAVFTATVSLPLAVPDTAGFPAVSGVATCPGLRVLVVEDNPALRTLLGAWLTELGCPAVLAEDGERALTLARAEDFDAALLDLSLPGMDGDEVARRLRSGIGAGWFIVGLSAHAGEAERAAALAAGMDEFLTKPIEFATLAATLRRGRTGLRLESGLLAGGLLTGEQVKAAREAAQRGLPGQVDALLSAAGEADWPGLARTAHHLCSTADVLGDGALRTACIECEDAARSGDAARSREAAEKISRLIDRFAEGDRGNTDGFLKP